MHGAREIWGANREADFVSDEWFQIIMGTVYRIKLNRKTSKNRIKTALILIMIPSPEYDVGCGTFVPYANFKEDNSSEYGINETAPPAGRQ